MSVSITGTSSNVQINNADLHVTNTSKKIIAPKAELSGISDIALTTSSNVGLVNTAPIHTLDVGSKFFVDETGATTVRVRGLLEADTINFGGSTGNRVFVSDGDGALSTDDGLQYNSSTNALTLSGALDANSTADIADTLTLSKGSGTGLSVTADATVGGTLDVTGATTLAGVSATTGDFSGAVGVDGNFDVATDKFTVVAASGNTTVAGTLGVSGASTLASASVTGAATVGTTLGVTGATTLAGLSATTGDFSGAVGIDGNFDVATDKFTVVAASGNTTVAGTLDVSGASTLASASVTGAATVGTTLDVTGATTLAGVSATTGDFSGAVGVDGDFDVATDKFTVASATGNTTVAGTLAVTGNSTLTGTLSSGAATLASASVTGAATVGTTLGVTGATTLAGLSATTGDFSGAVGVDGNFDVATDKFTVVAASGNTSIAGTLAVTGNSTLTGTLSSGAATLASASVTGAATVGSTLGVTGATTLAGLSATTGDFSGAVGVDGNFDVATDKFTVASASGNTTVAGTLGVSGASTLASASITGAGDALTVTNNAVISGQMRADSGLIDNNLQVNGNLIVDGELTVVQTNNLVVDDPLIELGNTNTNGGAVIDVGMVFRQPAGNSNVVTFYDGSDSKYRIALTNNGAYDSAITTTGAIEVEVTGNVTASTITADALTLGGSNIRIEGNSIVFG